MTFEEDQGLFVIPEDEQWNTVYFRLKFKFPRLITPSLIHHMAWVLEPYLSKEKIEWVAYHLGYRYYIYDWSNGSEDDIPF